MPPTTFKSLYTARIKDEAGKFHPAGYACHAADTRLCHACHASVLEYDTEIHCKNSALQEYWNSNINAAVPLLPLIRSPFGRRYRSVSKRKVVRSRNGLSLALLSPDEDGNLVAMGVRDCLIEPAAHNAIYALVRENLDRPALAPLANALTYIIVKGSSREQTVIFNVRAIDGPIVKSANGLSRSLTQRNASVKGVFLFEGEGDDRYYLGAKKPSGRLQVRKLFGKDQIYERVQGKSFLFSPFSFTQVNPGIVPALMQKMRESLAFTGNETLYDFYCGYGLFAVSFAADVRRVLGAEWSVASIEDAKRNAERNGAINSRFVHSTVDAASVAKMVERASRQDVAILDPPRHGTAPGVIEAIGRTRMRRIMHLFCNIELLGTELRRWETAGYAPDTAVPFDMFPGTDNVEVLVAFSPSA